MIITNIQERPLGWVLTCKGTKRKVLLKKNGAHSLEKQAVALYFETLQKEAKSLAKQKKICRGING